MSALPYALAAGVGYLLGALPFGVVVARANGVDIFAVGSRNPGATNVKRCIGRGAGNLVFALDFLKGALAAVWPRLLPAVSVDPRLAVWCGLIGLAAAILGHVFPVFTGFRGGKGVATMLGGTVALMPLAALAGAAVWVALFYATRYVSLASIGLALALPVARGLLAGFDALFWFAVALAAFVILRHRENIIRLCRGTENRFSRPAGETRGPRRS